MLLFPLRYPLKLDTAFFGGISTNICTWPAHISASIFLPFSTHTVVFISFLLLISFLHRTPFCDIWVQILSDICNSIWCAINYLCHSCSSECPPFVFFLQLADRKLFIPKGVLFHYRLLAFIDPLVLRVVLPYKKEGGVCRPLS